MTHEIPRSEGRVHAGGESLGRAGRGAVPEGLELAERGPWLRFHSGFFACSAGKRRASAGPACWGDEGSPCFRSRQELLHDAGRLAVHEGTLAVGSPEDELV